MSAGLWLAARSPRVSASRLHTLGLAYEIVICFIIATITFWQCYIVNGILPNLTWVPVVIVLFPLTCRARRAAARRRQSARELSRRLADIEVASPWTEDRARDWWDRYQSTPHSD